MNKKYIWIITLVGIAFCIPKINALKHTFLITEHHPVSIQESKNIEMGILLNKDKDNPVFIQVDHIENRWDIAKTLWPILLFGFCLLVISVEMYSINNYRQLKKAKKKADAALSDTTRCKKELEELYDEEIIKARHQIKLEEKEALRIKLTLCHNKEKSIMEKERQIQQKEDQINQYIEQWQQEKEHFTKAFNHMKQTKSNAKSAQIRLKNEKQLISQFLEQSNWKIEGEKLTYEKLKSLSKEHNKITKD